VLTLQTVWWREVAIATVFIGLRYWARILKRGLGVDDVLMTASWTNLFLPPFLFFFLVFVVGRELTHATRSFT
jgi:hypothetical protein